MRRITYYYDSLMKSSDGRYSVDYFCSDSRVSIWAGRITEDSPTEALKKAWDVVDELNKPRAFFGREGRLAQWFWWKNKTKELKRK